MFIKINNIMLTSSSVLEIFENFYIYIKNTQLLPSS